MFHIGYFYNLSPTCTRYNNLVLGFENNSYKFYIIDDNLLRKKGMSGICCYNTLTIPVIFQKSGCKITEIIFLTKLPDYCSLQNEGYYLFDNGETFLIFDSSRDVSRFIDSPEIRQLLQIVLKQVYLRRRISEVSKQINYVSDKDQYLPKKWMKVVKGYSDYVENLNVKYILSTLSVRVWDHYRTKIGDDDTYTVFREAHVEGESRLDSYLKSLIGIGEHEIMSIGVYGGGFQRPDINMGVYCGKVLREEQEKLLKQYSPTDHIGWLFYEQLFKQRDLRECILPRLVEELGILDKTVDEKYFLAIIKEIPQKLFNSFGSLSLNPQDSVLKINNYIERLLRNMPVLKVVITGTYNIYNRKEKADIEKILKNLFRKLLKHYRITIVSGNAEGGERLSIEFAEEEFIDFELIPFSRSYGLCDIDRAKELVNNVEMVIVIGRYDNVISQNILNAARKKNKKIKYL